MVAGKRWVDYRKVAKETRSAAGSSNAQFGKIVQFPNVP